MTFHSIHDGLLVACDDCGCAVSSTDRDRALHARWHESQLDESNVVDLTREHVAQELRRIS